MVSHRHRRTILTALGLYTFAALFIGYFAVNAFTGNHRSEERRVGKECAF